jgi:outer membrane lipoprotein-sorting protein
MMKKSYKANLTIVFTLFTSFFVTAQDAHFIISKADEKMQGKSNESQMTMTIVRPTYTRSIEFKNWSFGRDYFMTYIVSPAKEKGQVFLKIKNELWNFIPSINRTIKMPPSVMSQGWMGSDYSNDELVKQSSIVVDYEQKILGDQILDNRECFIIELIPFPEATVVWGKIITWVDKNDYIILKSEYYDEQLELVRTEFAKDLKIFDNRLLPSIIEIIPNGEEGFKTVITIQQMKFDIPILETFFSQQNMKKVR